MKISWFDYKAAWDAVRRFAERLLDERKEVEEIRVFGSIVRGECVPGSDVDVLIILRDHELPFPARISLYLPREALPVDVDVFPYTREELSRMQEEGNSFVQRALQEGIVIAKRGC